MNSNSIGRIDNVSVAQTAGILVHVSVAKVNKPNGHVLLLGVCIINIGHINEFQEEITFNRPIDNITGFELGNKILTAYLKLLHPSICAALYNLLDMLQKLLYSNNV